MIQSIIIFINLRHKFLPVSLAWIWFLLLIFQALIILAHHFNLINFFSFETKLFWVFLVGLAIVFVWFGLANALCPKTIFIWWMLWGNFYVCKMNEWNSLFLYGRISFSNFTRLYDILPWSYQTRDWITLLLLFFSWLFLNLSVLEWFYHMEVMFRGILDINYVEPINLCMLILRVNTLWLFQTSLVNMLHFNLWKLKNNL